MAFNIHQAYQNIKSVDIKDDYLHIHAYVLHENIKVSREQPITYGTAKLHIDENTGFYSAPGMIVYLTYVFFKSK